MKRLNFSDAPDYDYLLKLFVEARKTVKNSEAPFDWVPYLELTDKPEPDQRGSEQEDLDELFVSEETSIGNFSDQKGTEKKKFSDIKRDMVGENYRIKRTINVKNLCILYRKNLSGSRLLVS